jgi:hypothetical protein
MADGESATLTPDQQAIIAKIAKSAPSETVHYARAPTDPIGEKVTLPLREGKAITLLRKSSVAQKDGSVTWSGTVEETGERAVLMLWGNAVLTGYLAYNGTIFTIESWVVAFTPSRKWTVANYRGTIPRKAPHAIAPERPMPRKRRSLALHLLSRSLRHLPMRSPRPWKPRKSRSIS